MLTAHRVVNTNERLHRYGLIDSPLCNRCDRIETAEHKILECEYISMIWRETFSRTSTITPLLANENDPVRKLFGVVKGINFVTLTVHAYVLNRVLMLNRNPEWSLRPKLLVENSIRALIKLEKSQTTRDILRSLLEQDETTQE